jgi:putative ABC transport system substrate-binding protein
MTTSLPAWHRRAPIGRASSRKDIAEAALPAEDRAAVDPAGGTRDPEALRIGAGLIWHHQASKGGPRKARTLDDCLTQVRQVHIAPVPCLGGVWPMTRRKFLTSLGAAMAMAWPIPALAQQPTPLIGYLGAETPDAFESRVRAFREGLSEGGFVDGRNVAIEFRWAEGQHNKLPALAADLVAHSVAVIVAPGGAPAALAARSVSTTIPIVFEMGADPVGIGLVETLQRPGTNLTGVTSLNVQVTPKRLEILHEVVPTAATIAVVLNPTSPTTTSQLKSLQAAADTLGVRIHDLYASNVRDIDALSATLTELRPGGLVVASDGFFATHSKQLAALAVRHALPAIHQSRDFAIAGGLMSYAGSFMESHRQAGIQTARILKGAKPAELPVQQVTKIELIINLKTAKTLGIAMPLTLLGGADEVIE